MRFRIETWTINQLISVHAAGNLDLSPPYQRNFIWSLEDQRILIESTFKNYPIPNIFLRELQPGNFEVVDGQQRTRTLVAFRNGGFTDFNDRLYNINDYPNFDQFPIAVIVIEDIAVDDISIEEFYGLVNSAGVHLNRPEVNKATYYDTKFLKLINICNDYTGFKNLGLFTDNVLKRMNDMDFVSELIVLLKDGITDKKDQIDRTFVEDITQAQYDLLHAKFLGVINNMNILNSLFPIRKTRYKQRNDFYTFFGFINDTNLPIEQLKVIYQILVLISSDISPSNDDCLPLQNYARNCVTQSNSKNARQERRSFYQSLFLNEALVPNTVQREILTYYEMLNFELQQNGQYYTIDLNQLKVLKPSIVFSA
ncbi:MAG: hypothetical protein JWQ63_1489 [Mucilaginibacter sp.]|nr:hypothetical protein [Mucilaginibacter sp.]